MILLVSCGDTNDIQKGEEEDPITQGKADSFFNPTFHGAIAFGKDANASIKSDEKIHAWTFSLSGEAEVILQTGENSQVDTVLYYYKKNTITNSWGPYKKKNDDFKKNDWSKITLEGERGQYRIIVKSHSKTERGSFSVRVNCHGVGCADEGEILRDDLRTAISEEHIVLGYRGARDQMYFKGGIDVVNGRIEGIYTGRAVDSDTTRAPSENCSKLDGTDFTCSLNTEHTFARHFLREHLIDKSPEFVAAESDLHHLFPSDQLANTLRGHLDFGETDCDKQETCRLNEESKLGLPTGESGSINCKRGAVLKKGESACVFQVRDLRKGDVARSQFYMAVRYGMPISDKSEQIMRKWNLQDPPDLREETRNDRIQAVQGNRNPFVDDPSLVDKITNF